MPVPERFGYTPSLFLTEVLKTKENERQYQRTSFSKTIFIPNDDIYDSIRSLIKINAALQKRISELEAKQ